jgi:hypothetical protein
MANRTSALRRNLTFAYRQPRVDSGIIEFDELCYLSLSRWMV